MSQFPFHVDCPETEGHTRTLTVTVDVTDQQPASKVMHYLRSVQLKNDIINQWVAKNAPGYGMEIRGGPRPVFADPKDRSSEVLGYAQEFRLTRPI